MKNRRNIFAIVGSTRSDSANLRLVRYIERLVSNVCELTIYNEIDTLPHFNPDLDNDALPIEISKFRNHISAADGILICTPEYVFSLPGSLKNALEWCVSTTILSEKPAGLITASANGKMAHESLQLIMETLGAEFNSESTLLISGISGKIDSNHIITDEKTEIQVKNFVQAFIRMVNNGRSEFNLA